MVTSSTSKPPTKPIKGVARTFHSSFEFSFQPGSEKMLRRICTDDYQERLRSFRRESFNSQSARVMTVHYEFIVPYQSISDFTEIARCDSYLQNSTTFIFSSMPNSFKQSVTWFRKAFARVGGSYLKKISITFFVVGVAGGKH